MKLQLKFIYILLSLLILFYIVTSILMNAMLAEGVYVHSQIDKYFWPAIAIFILISLCYIFIIQTFRVKKILLRIILAVIFTNVWLLIVALFFTMFIFGYSDPKVVNIDGENYIVEKEMINPHRWKYNFYEELNWYSMKEVTKEENDLLSKKYMYNEDKFS